MSVSLVPAHLRARRAIEAAEYRRDLQEQARLSAGRSPEQKTLSAHIASTIDFWLGVGASDRIYRDSLVRGPSAYALSALLYICMRFRAKKLAEAPLWIVQEEDDGESFIKGRHELEEVLEQPNPDMSMVELLELVSLYLDMPGGGQCLLVKTRDRIGRVASLYPFPRGEFTVEPTRDRLFGRFRLRGLNGVWEDLDPEEVIFLREADTRSLLSSVSPGDAALSHLNIGESQRAAVREAFKNAISPSAWVQLPEDRTLGDEEFRRLREQLAENYGGFVNAGKPMLVEGGGVLHMLESSLTKLDLGPVMVDVESTVCAAFEIHPFLLGLRSAIEKGGGGMSDSLDPALQLFYDQAVVPRWTRIADKLTRALLRDVDPNPRRHIRFVRDGIRALQEDMAEKVETAAKATFWTDNEKRAYTGKDPLDDPAADELRRPPAVPDPSAGAGGDDTEQGGGGSTEEEDDPDSKSSGVVDRIRRLAAEQKALDPREVERLLWAAFLRDQELAVMSSVRQVLQAQLGDISAIILRHTSTLAADASAEVVAQTITNIIGEADRMLSTAGVTDWNRFLRPALQEVALTAAGRLPISLGISFELVQPGLIQYVQDHAAELIKGVTDTTKQRVRDALSEGLREGEGITDLAKRIQETGGPFDDKRARLIARTESVTVANGAQLQSVREHDRRLGVRTYKTWLTANDERVRPEHRELEGETVPVDKEFSNGLQHPSEPNCRCTLTYTTVDDQED